MEEESKDDICSICNNIKQHKTNTFVCTHSFCQICIVKWYQECKYKELPCTCPICRKIDDIWGT